MGEGGSRDFGIKVEAGQRWTPCAGLHEVFENNVPETENETTLDEVQSHLVKSEWRQHSGVLQRIDSVAQLLEFDDSF